MMCFCDSDPTARDKRMRFTFVGPGVFIPRGSKVRAWWNENGSYTVHFHEHSADRDHVTVVRIMTVDYLEDLP